MSRALSNPALDAIFDAQTDECFVVLIEISHPELTDPIRVNSSGQDIVHSGDTYIFYPFEIVLPEDQDAKNPRAQLSIDNIDRQIVLAVRSISSAPSVSFKVVLASSPDVVEASFSDFKLINVTYDSQLVKGDLSIEDFTSEPFPQGTFTPSLFPGIFS